MNRTPEEWAKVSPDAVASGSWAQSRNVLQMALQDIARMATEIKRLQAHADTSQLQGGK
jgi:hypothetical protein